MLTGKALLRAILVVGYYGAVYAAIMALDAGLAHWQGRPFHAAAARREILLLMLTILPMSYLMQRASVIQAITGRGGQGR